MMLEPLRPGDIDRLEPLWLALHAHHRRVAPQLAPFVADEISWANRRRQYLEVTAGEWFGFMARDGGRDVGYLLCARRPMVWNATFAVPSSLWELVTLVVHEDARGRGIGSKLLAAMDESVARQDVQTQLIGAVPDNHSAVALYQARGYRPTWLMLTRFQRPATALQARRAIEVRLAGPADVPALEPLWLALHHHHQAVSPELGPFVTDEASWPIVGELLSQSAREGLLLVAQDRGRPVGLASAAIYGMEDLASFSDTWVTGEKVAEIKFLVVAGDKRGKGVGATLMAAADRELAARSVDDRFVGTIAQNEDAIGFYEARGFRRAWLELTKFQAPALNATYRRPRSSSGRCNP